MALNSLFVRATKKNWNRACEILSSEQISATPFVADLSDRNNSAASSPGSAFRGTCPASQ
jgi:hypothetical protein